MEDDIQNSKTTGEDKRQHLIFIQDVITRMASNSFLIKGWSVAGIGALYVFWIDTQNLWKLWLVLVVTILFWIHDAYYLKLERDYRALYDCVRNAKESEIDYSMKASNTCSMLEAAVRPILIGSYGILTVVTIILICINRGA